MKQININTIVTSITKYDNFPEEFTHFFNYQKVLNKPFNLVHLDYRTFMYYHGKTGLALFRLDTIVKYSFIKNTWVIGKLLDVRYDYATGNIELLFDAKDFSFKFGNFNLFKLPK